MSAINEEWLNFEGNISRVASIDPNSLSYDRHLSLNLTALLNQRRQAAVMFLESDNREELEQLKDIYIYCNENIKKLLVL